MATPSRNRTPATAEPFRAYRARPASGRSDLDGRPSDAAFGLEGRSMERVVFDEGGIPALDRMRAGAPGRAPAQPAGSEGNGMIGVEG